MSSPVNFKKQFLGLVLSRCLCGLLHQVQLGNPVRTLVVAYWPCSLFLCWRRYDEITSRVGMASEFPVKFFIIECKRTAANKCKGQLLLFTESPDILGQGLDVSTNFWWIMMFYIRRCRLSASRVLTDCATVAEIMKCDVQDFVLKTTKPKCLPIGSLLSAAIYCSWKKLGRC